MSNKLVEEISKYLNANHGQPRPGLVNPGNASYMCASFQALYACEWFRKRVMDEGYGTNASKILKALSNLFIGFTIEMRKSYPISDFQKMVIAGNPQFGAQSEHNPIVFIVELFKLLDEGLGDDHSVTKVFKGFLNWNMSCKNPNCKYKWTTIPEFNVVDLYVPPPKNVNYFSMDTMIRNLDAVGTNIDTKCDKNQCDKGVVARKTFHTTNEHLIFNLRRGNADITNRKVRIQNVIEVLGQQFNLVSFICYNMSNGVIQSYSCCARFGQNWYRFDNSEVIHISFDGKFNMHQFADNVQILFYQIAGKACNFDIIDGDLLSMRKPLPELPQPAPDLDLIHATLGRGAGLRNLGDTCYMNATLQALFHCEDFRLHIMFGLHYGQFLGKFHIHLRKLFQGLLNTRQNSHYIPDLFVDAFVGRHPDFVIREQHDTREFLGELFNRLNEEANVGRNITVPNADLQDSEEAWRQYMAGNNNSHMVQTFAFQNETRSVCSKCNGNWIRFSHSWITLLVFPPNVGTNPVDVQTCINHALLAEPVQMTCLRCHINCKVNRFTSIRRPPRVLVIQLQIYVVNPWTYVGSKLNPNLTVNEFITVANELFICFACVLHTGATTNEGHYTSFCKRGNNWHYFNDTNVTLVSINNFPAFDNRMKNTYLVFYERASAKHQLKNKEVSAIDFSGISVPEHLLRSGSGYTSGISRRGRGRGSRGNGRAPPLPGHQR